MYFVHRGCLVSCDIVDPEQTTHWLFRLSSTAWESKTHTRTHTERNSRSHSEPRNSSRIRIAAAALLFTPILKSSVGPSSLPLVPFSFLYLLIPLFHMSSGPLALAVTEITFSQTTASDPPPPPLQSFILLPKTSKKTSCPPLWPLLIFNSILALFWNCPFPSSPPQARGCGFYPAFSVTLFKICVASRPAFVISELPVSRVAQPQGPEISWVWPVADKAEPTQGVLL